MQEALQYIRTRQLQKQTLQLTTVYYCYKQDNAYTKYTLQKLLKWHWLMVLWREAGTLFHQWGALYLKNRCEKVKLYQYGDTKNGLTLV